jgi:D-alanyl-D-alanine carboxypeptidase
MIKKISLFSAIFVAVSIFATANMHAESKGKVLSVVASERVAPPESLTTDIWGIFDPETGILIEGNNTRTVVPVASLTKLITAVAVMQSDEKNEQFEIVASDVNTEGRAGKLVIGTKTSPYELLFPLLLESSNDAGVAIGRSLGDDFEKSRDKIIDSLSLTQTHIEEPTGLSDKNVSTVRDLSVFFSYLKNSYPHIVDITSLNTYLVGHTGYGNSNPIHTIPGFTGGKQGYTDEAGRTFVGTFLRSNTTKEIGVVVLGSDNLETDINAILSYSERLSDDSDILRP